MEADGSWPKFDRGLITELREEGEAWAGWAVP